ncbi:class I SAM-dependent methyltransferase [Halomonas sp. M20]|uniref:class I SAM-dependent methyltransferase n=1 Tax=Halomonas sp. M20 TaxID=2763264 RepID=UPI001D0AE543|nr:methyltransferase domain-containing protein [Halomonas sp. M20]
MSKTFNDIDSLIDRLKSVARQLDIDDPSAEPPPSVDRKQLLERLNAEPEIPIKNPWHPRLEELVTPLSNDPAFLQRSYRLLMGRDVDPVGLQNYLSELPRSGRLYVLADLLCASECRQHLATKGIVIPRQRVLRLPLRVAGRLGPLGKLARPPLRLGYRLVNIIMRPQWRARERLARLEAEQARRNTILQDILIELENDVRRQDAELEQGREEIKEQMQDAFAKEAERIDELERHQPGLWSALQHQRRAVERLVADPAQLPASPKQAEALSQDLIDAYYLAFEDACRGSEAQIAAHLRQYQPQIDTARQAGKKALDVGCGRGEWLKLLASEGFAARGVDLNVAMVDHCHTLGFDVVHDDAIAELRRQPEGSHALISAFHIAEHLPFDVLYALVDEAQRVLAPGGVLILETPNPENILVGSHTFYHDPTHLNPLTPTAMSFLLTYHGFAEVEVRRFNPYPEKAKVPGNDPLTERVNGHLCGPQDFAVVGLKTAPAELPGQKDTSETYSDRRDDEIGASNDEVAGNEVARNTGQETRA